ncbi:MAG: adenylate kinase [Acidobacteriota bacterium]
MGASSIVFLGPPNSGKGTQAARLATSLGIPAISTGEMLRGAVAAGSELGARVKDIMSQGLLVSDELMAEVIEDRLGQADAATGFLLDGYPRTLPQVATLDGIVSRRGSMIDHVVLIDAPQQVLVDRARERYVRLKRPDDKPEVVIERLAQYREKTEPLVNHYRDRGLLRVIDGDQSMEAVEAAILEAVGGQ